ncbi:MAG: C4-type zinc ribbon domain-containing protein [Chloroflexota bacterium]
MSAALGLFRLQQIDSHMDQARARLEAIRQTLENDADLKAASAKLADAEARARAARSALRDAEAEAQRQRIKIEQAEASLYGGGVRNPKELQDLQHDVASLKKYLVTLEDRLLEAMLASESAESALTEARAELKQVEASRGNQNQNLSGEQSELVHQMERFTSERQAALSALDVKLLDLYETLRAERRGVAVTAVADGACASCGTTLTASQQQNARSAGQLFHCPTCGRILYAD